MAGTWSALNNLPTSGVSTTLLLTDGTMIGQGSSVNTWQKLGSVVNRRPENCS